MTDSTLVRKRTQAKQRAEAGGRHAVGSSSANAPRIVENVRKGSVMIPPVASGGIGLVGGGGYGAPQTGSPSSMPGRLPMVDESRTHSPHHSPHHSQQHQHSTHSSPKGRPSPLPSSNQPFTNSTSPRVRPSQVNGGGSPQPQPQQQQQQQHLQKPFANAQRYSLVDPGSGGGGEAGSPKPQQHSGTPPPGRRTPQQQQQQQQAPTVGGGQPQQQEIPQLGYGGGPAGRPSKGPQTFAEMGIQSTKLENKDCVIM